MGGMRWEAKVGFVAGIWRSLCSLRHILISGNYLPPKTYYKKTEEEEENEGAQHSPSQISCRIYEIQSVSDDIMTAGPWPHRLLLPSFSGSPTGSQRTRQRTVRKGSPANAFGSPAQPGRVRAVHEGGGMGRRMKGKREIRVSKMSATIMKPHSTYFYVNN